MAMVMERLDAAGKHPENQEPVQQFAIKEAKRLLRNAGVKDPGQKKIEVQSTRDALDADKDSFDRPKRDILNPELAGAVRNIVVELPMDLPFGSLIYWDLDRKAEFVKVNEQSIVRRSSTSELVKDLLKAPEAWVIFMRSQALVKKSAISRAFGQVLASNPRRPKRQESTAISLTTPLVDIASKLGEENAVYWEKSEYFVRAVFKDIASK